MRIGSHGSILYTRAACAALAVWMLAASAPASTVYIPGHTDSVVGTVSTTVGNHFGTVVEDDAGNIYATGAWTPDVYIKTPMASSFSIFVVMPTATSVGQAIEGNTLYVGMGNGTIYSLDLASPAPSPVLIATASGDVNNIVLGCAGLDMVVATSTGLYSVVIATGVVTPITTGYSAISSCACAQSGTEILFTDFNGDRIMEATPPSSIVQFYAPTASDPDCIAVHPVTGDVYVGTSGPNQIQRIDAAGATITLFADITSFDGGWYPSPLGFSRDGTKLYYGTYEMSAYTIRAIDGFPPLAGPRVRTVDAPDAIVYQGFSGYAVTATVENTSMNAVTVTSVDLIFTGSADRTSEYTVMPSPANPVSIAPGATEIFAFTVDVSASATVEMVTIDASFTGVDAVTMLAADDAEADTTDAWDVLMCAAVLCGDCNGDGVVSILDALTGAQHSAALIALAGASFTNCNVTGIVEPTPGAVVDILDALALAQFAAGLPTLLVCC